MIPTYIMIYQVKKLAFNLFLEIPKLVLYFAVAMFVL